MKEEEESDQDKLDLEATEILREEQGTHRVLTDLFIALLSLPRICAGQMRLFTIQLNFLVYLKDLEHMPIRLCFICTQTSSFDWLNVIFC